MQLLTALAVVAAVLGLVAADYNTVKVADNEFLLKQKKIYNLIYHVPQPSLVNPTLYEEGRSYNIEANIDSYTNTTAVKNFLYLYEYGMLPRGELSSPYYKKSLKETEALFRLFYYAKDFDTFYKTASWARIYMNEMTYIYALYSAVVHREDTKFLQLPPTYEIYPYMHFNSEVLEKAHHAKFFGKLDSKKFGDYNTYIIPANYSGWYMSREYDVEHKLNYFTEDIGLSTYYFYLRLDKPFWLKSEEFGLQKWRGLEYLYDHKLLMTRYYLERLSNDLGSVEDFDWHAKFHTGYYPTMTYHNGLPFPQRPYLSKFPYYKYTYIKDLEDMESRVSAAIDSGFIRDTTGKFINIYTLEGLNLLGNIIEGNMDSCNRDFYGSIDLFARKILGYNLEPSNPSQIIPSALEFYSTSMKDPAFYRLYKRIYQLYYRYNLHKKPYNKNEIIYPELKIESFVVDKLITYFDQFDSTISNGLMIDNAEEAENTLVKIRQYRLNHKPFSFHLAINAEKPMKAAIRIFLGPKFNVHHKPLDFAESTKYFYEMDNWIVNLNAGANKIVRNNEDCIFLIPDPEPSEVFYKKVLKALDSSDTFSYTERVYGFPQRLLLPKGKKEGMPFQFFVYVNPVEEEFSYTSRVFGDSTFDYKPPGFPLDQPTFNFRYDGPNMMLKDVLISFFNRPKSFARCFMCMTVKYTVKVKIRIPNCNSRASQCREEFDKSRFSRRGRRFYLFLGLHTGLNAPWNFARLSKALPILKADDSLPKVAKVHPLSQNSVDMDEEESHSRSKRSNPDSALITDTSRNGRKFCENGGGVVCMLYKAIQGEPISSSASVIERRDEPSTSEYRRGERVPSQEKTEYTGPPTPCPAKVEYATPVFAKNYQGVWRYVVQIPYEGYFTQTIELTRCMQSRCHYLDGGCLSSPRWTSLLVAEIFYPDTFLEENQTAGIGSGTRDPVAGSPPPVHDFQNYQQYLQKRASTGEARNNGSSQQHHCDGVDEMGCFQVRLYYDWFLVPGSCKCWRPDYFNRYVRRSSSNIEL